MNRSFFLSVELITPERVGGILSYAAPHKHQSDAPPAEPCRTAQDPRPVLVLKHELARSHNATSVFPVVHTEEIRSVRAYLQRHHRLRFTS